MRRQEKRNGMQTLTKQLACSSAGPVDGPFTAEPSLKAVSHEKRKARESASRRASAIPSESPKADELDAGCSMDAVVRRANKRFAALDREGTGLLDRERIKVLADCVWAVVRPDGKELSASELEAELKHLQRRLDAADDGQMDFGEFEAYLRRRGANISKQRQLSMRRETELKPPNQRLMQKSMSANESLHSKLFRSSGGAEKKPDADSVPLLAAVRQGDLRAVEARFLLCSQCRLYLPTSHACRQ
jgi:Ca2+-binding EF-hand superfamily protein